tara:strand:+ start:548 stop:739 length:192 start_codon:yes stop_codon:yes gene_type:complete
LITAQSGGTEAEPKAEPTTTRTEGSISWSMAAVQFMRGSRQYTLCSGTLSALAGRVSSASMIE